MNMLRRKGEDKTQVIDTGNATTEVLNLEQPPEEPQRPASLADLWDDYRKTVGQQAMKALGIQPPPEPTKWQRVSNWFEDRFYDEQWHKAARQTAGTLLMWSFTIAASVCFGKGLWWILSL